MPVAMKALISGHQVSTVPARVGSWGVWESMHQDRNRCSRRRVRCASPPTRTGDSRVRSSSLAIHAERIWPVSSSDTMAFHIFVKLLSDKRFPRLKQPTPVGPLRIEFAAAAIAELPGDAAAHLGERIVGQLD